MNHTNGMRGPIRISHHAVGQNPAGLRGTSDGCFRSCSASTALELLLRLVHQHRDFGLELCKFCVGCLGQRSDDEQRARVQGVESDPHDLSKTTFHSVPNNGVSNGLGYDETHACSVGIISINQAVCHQMGRAHTDASFEDSSEVVSAADPVSRGDHTYAETSARPLRRRAARIERPARVRMRRRKPCFLARLRLLGWKVRLLTSSLRFLGCGRTTMRSHKKRRYESRPPSTPVHKSQKIFKIIG